MNLQLSMLYENKHCENKHFLIILTTFLKITYAQSLYLCIISIQWKLEIVATRHLSLLNPCS